MKAVLVDVNTPRRLLNKSPAELLLGGAIRNGLPATRDLLVPKHQADILPSCQAIKEHKLALSKKDRLTELSVGQPVAAHDQPESSGLTTGKLLLLPETIILGKLDYAAVLWWNRISSSQS